MVVPKFQPTYEEHLSDYDEVLPHVLMGDFVRFLFDAYRKAMPFTSDAEDWHRVVTKSLALMERAIASEDPWLVELISVSFIENLVPSTEQDAEIYKAIKVKLGPKLREELKLYESV